MNTGTTQEKLGRLEAYAQFFEDAVEEQREVERHIESMIAAGHMARMSLNTLMESAFARGDASGAYYAGRAQAELLLSQS